MSAGFGLTNRFRQRGMAGRVPLSRFTSRRRGSAFYVRRHHAHVSPTMTSEFDHVFICVSVGGEEAGALAAFGLTEGTPNVHPGQGTACRRFFFANNYLELLWVSNAGEAQSEAIQPTHL